MILYRYFAREIFFTMFAVAGIVLVISLGWRFSGYLNQAAAGALTKDVLFLVITYRLPGFLELIVPISFFLAIMLSYGRLYVDSEMVVLESCGMSPLKLIGITLVLSLVIMAITAVVTLWLKPSGEARVEELLKDQQTMTEFDTLAPGRFQNLRSGERVTYAEKLNDDGMLLDVFINEYRQSDDSGARDVVTINADQGETRTDAEGNRFLVLKNGTRYQGRPGEMAFQVVEYEEFGQVIEKQSARLEARRRTAIPTQELLTEPNLRNLSELQWRISVIMMIPVFALMAVPLSKVNPRQGRFTRLVPGMLLCFLYVVGLSAGRSAVEKGQIPVELGIWWIHGLFLGIVVVLFNLDKLPDLPFRKRAS